MKTNIDGNIFKQTFKVFLFELLPFQIIVTKRAIRGEQHVGAKYNRFFRDVFRTLSNIYDWIFLQKQLRT